MWRSSKFIWALCAQLYSLARPHNLLVFPLPPHLGSYTRTLLVNQDRRHLSVTPWCEESQEICYSWWITLAAITCLVYGPNLCPISPNPEGILPLKSHFHPRWKEWRKLPRVRDLFFPSSYFRANLERKLRQFLFFLQLLPGILHQTSPESNNFVYYILLHPLIKWSFALTVISGLFKNNMHSLYSFFLNFPLSFSLPLLIESKKAELQQKNKLLRYIFFFLR